LAKKSRREQQHLRQKPTRQRTYRSGEAPGEKYKPGFPVNIFMNTKVFVIVGLGIMAGGVILAAVLQPRDTVSPGELPELPTATVADVDPDVSPTPDPRQFEAAEDVIDPDAFEYRAIITTDKGVIEIDFFEDVAPRTVNNFVFLAQNGYFDDLRWHRVEPNFVVQAGDPLSEEGRELADPSLIGTGGPGYLTEEEPNELSNTRGRISMAKVGGASNFGSQFFINLKDNPALDAGQGSADFFPFAEVVSGMDIVDSIDQWDRIHSVEIIETPRPGAPANGAGGDGSDNGESADEPDTESEDEDAG
jgi:cyclophilin family peptidyl-prolyl cis-trans isomerase